MKFLNYLSEEWVTSVKNFKRVSDIFVNPNSKELKEIERKSWGGQVRFLADFKEKKLYVWSSELIHYLAIVALADENLLSSEDFDLVGKYCVPGIGVIIGNKIKFEEFYDGATQRQLKNVDWRKKDGKWLDRNFIEPFLKTAEKLISELP
ncbi:MAG: hypothetical protein WC503_01030 [Candidatus Shapirobacteria bacterium]